MTTVGSTSDYEWALAIFAARESLTTLHHTINAALTACGDEKALIDVLVNGNLDLAERSVALVSNLSLKDTLSIRLWYLPIPDKAETWNRYLHELWPSARCTFFIDGYAAAMPNALSEIAIRLDRDPSAYCATGVPSDGFSAKRLRRKMLREHGIHGNLYAIPHDVIQYLRSLPFRLPQGIYRTDPTLGAALSFSLDPANHDWTPAKLIVVPEASWHLPPHKWWTLAAFKSQWKRKFRQALGDFENSAIRQHLALDRRSPASLPATSKELVENWAAGHPDAAKDLARQSWWHRNVLRDISATQAWRPVGRPAEMLKSLNYTPEFDG